MIKKRLIEQVPSSKKYIALTVLLQWFKLAANIGLMFALSAIIGLVIGKEKLTAAEILPYIGVVAAAIAVRYVCTFLSSRTSFEASAQVKKVLREKMYRKLTRMGASYHEKVSTSEVIQVFVEGIDQLELYFGKYLPQLLFSLLAPLTLFAVLSFVNFKAAIVLLVCVPLIPISIVAVQKIAKKLLSKYWGVYVNLGDTFLENIQGLTTLKIYRADERKNEEMNEKAEEFRRITMKVLTMQLNSVSVMDIVAYAGSALGVIISVYEVWRGNLAPEKAFLIIMLAADFFLPLRLLGSFFHVAMNGMAASDKLFNLLDIPEEEKGTLTDVDFENGISLSDVSFSYDGDRSVISKISLEIPKSGLIGVVGESGCGKSTIASLICGTRTGYGGSIKIGGTELREISEETLMKNITSVNFNSFVFSGTVRENLLVSKPDATDEEMLSALEKVRLKAFFLSQNGLETELSSQGGNLSGGQRQRLALARALLHDTPIYVFDEVTSSIDAESEESIVNVIYEISKTKAVVMISHRLENVVRAKRILLLENGVLSESGTHEELMNKKGKYFKMYSSQFELENYGGKELLS
ncbi:MAG: ABC transporter ATP-binding protein/permease [Clostridia bacterium]|nr:ABC transporter ATP-binding protein/permease [Clostridia bacterium]